MTMNISLFNHRPSLLNPNAPIIKVKREEVQTFNHTIQNIEEVERSMRETSAKHKMEFEKTSTDQKITKLGPKQVHDYFSFIYEIEDLTFWERGHIMSIIQDITSIPQGTKVGFDPEMLLIAETNFELNELCEKLIPEKYQTQMKEAIQSYISDRIEQQFQVCQSVYQGLYKRAAQFPEPTRSLWINTAQKNLQQLQDGTHRIYVAEKLYMDLFEKLKTADSENFTTEFEKILTTFKEEQKKRLGVYWTQSDEILTKEFQESMRKKWSNFVNHLAEFEKTKENPVNYPVRPIIFVE